MTDKAIIARGDAKGASMLRGLRDRFAQIADAKETPCRD